MNIKARLCNHCCSAVLIYIAMEAQVMQVIHILSLSL